MDFLQTKSKPWSHSLFIYLFTYLFLFTVKEMRKEMAGGGKFLVLWRGGGRKSKPQQGLAPAEQSRNWSGRGRRQRRLHGHAGAGTDHIWEGRTGVI